jgi:hypothetical protein
MSSIIICLGKRLCSTVAEPEPQCDAATALAAPVPMMMFNRKKSSKILTI